MFPAKTIKSYWPIEYHKLKPTLRLSEEAEPVQDDDDSDEEDDETDAVDGQQTEMEPEYNDDTDDKFMTGVMESFIKRCSVLKTRRGRAGLVHNFLRGLQLMSEPSGEPRLLRGGGVGGGTWVNLCWVRAAGLSEPLPHYSHILWPIIDPILVTFG